MLLILQEHLISMGLTPSIARLTTIASSFGVLGFGSWVLMLIGRQYLSKTIYKILTKAKYPWVKEIQNHKIFNKLSLLIPGILFYMLAPMLSEFGQMGVYISKATAMLSAIFLVGLAVMICSSILNVVVDTYEKFEVSKRNPIRSYVQVVKIILFSMGTILTLSILLDKDPVVFFTGLGAAMAILLLVFKDTILGFVASVQIAFYDVVRIGDWITVSSFGADGTVEEISLTTVKIRNFDKTISTIPTYSLLTAGVKNWRGMKESGGRRIKRSISIDMETITFCSEDMLERFEKIELLKGPLKNRQDEIIAYNREIVGHQDIPINGRMMTNLGVFRMYLNEYLNNNPHIHKNGFTFLIRQLEPTENGIPLELYIFTNDTDWVNYESIQSDIFDHILASMPIFELKVFQSAVINQFPQVLAPKKASNQTTSPKKTKKIA